MSKAILIVELMLTACVFERSEVAQQARSALVGRSQEQILSCMGRKTEPRPDRRRYGSTTQAAQSLMRAVCAIAKCT